MNIKRARSYIIEALLQLMERKNYNDITITDIARRAGVNRTTFYRNFSNKDEVIKAYLDDITEDFIRRKKVNYHPSMFKEYIITLFYHLKEQEKIGVLLYRANIIHYIKYEFDKIFYNKAKTKKEQYNYYFISGGLFNVYYNWLINGFVETPEELSDMFIDFFNI